MRTQYFQNSAESAESRVKLMSDEIMELRKTTENTKILRKLERKLKGTRNVIEEDKKNLERLNMAADKVNILTLFDPILVYIWPNSTFKWSFIV